MITMDKPAVWSDMVGKTTVNTAGAKNKLLKSTGNEKLSQFMFDCKSVRNQDETIHSFSGG